MNLENKRKMLSISVVLLGIVIIIVMAVSILGNRNQTNNQGNNVVEDTTNYTTTPEGSKVNTSEEVATDKKVGNILLEQSKIVYENGTSKLTSKVTNDATAKDNLRFTVKFIANDGTTIAQSVGYVGAIKENETRYIDSYITSDVSNAKDVVYEVLE